MLAENLKSAEHNSRQLPIVLKKGQVSTPERLVDICSDGRDVIRFQHEAYVRSAQAKKLQFKKRDLE